MTATTPLLAVEDLHVSFATEEGSVRAVDGISFSVEAGEVVAIVGESGSGKSAAVMALLGLNRGPNSIIQGQARFADRDLITASSGELQKIRGGKIAMVFQDPMSSLDPVYRIGTQIVEQIRLHEPGVSRAQARDRAVELIERMGIPRPHDRISSYPHQFSGGMRQRVMIAMALSCSPKLLIADEPTTALDVTVQAQILGELRRLRDETGTGIILVTHDLGVVADIADRILVMYAGQIVEQGGLDEVFHDSQHPYTWGLLGSITRIDRHRGGQLPGIRGQPPSLLAPPAGCHFRPRCPHAFDRCANTPELTARLPESPSQLDRCWLEPARKRSLRQVAGQIGLSVEAGEHLMRRR